MNCGCRKAIFGHFCLTLNTDKVRAFCLCSLHSYLYLCTSFESLEMGMKQSSTNCKSWGQWNKWFKQDMMKRKISQPLVKKVLMLGSKFSRLQPCLRFCLFPNRCIYSDLWALSDGRNFFMIL